ncbi:hypothetical protein PENTCL1PPCAC_7118, partial [Pristionchus entomophagus]
SSRIPLHTLLVAHSLFSRSLSSSHRSVAMRHKSEPKKADTTTFCTSDDDKYHSTMPSPTSSTAPYIITSNLAANSPSSEDDEDRGVLGLGGASGTRAHPETITWLKANYEKADGSSLPRCTLYEHYKR